MLAPAFIPKLLALSPITNVTPKVHYVVNNISAYYDAETDTVWVCNECIRTNLEVRFYKRLWIILEAYL